MEKREEWTLAAKNGLYLSIVTVVASILGLLFPTATTFNTIVVLMKYTAVVFLVYTFMKRYADMNETVSYNESFRYGFKICLLSSLVCTFWVAVLYLFIQPEVIDTILETTMATLENSGMPVDFEYEELRAILPSAIITSQLLNCIFWGVILPLIIANWTKKEAPLFE